MKTIFVTLLTLLFAFNSFSGNYIGETKKELLKNIKKDAITLKTTKDSEGGGYSICAKFQTNTVYYSFTKEGICYFYVVVEKYYLDNYLGMINYYDDRYLRAFDKNTDVWKEPKGDYFVYRWIVKDINGGTQYTVFLTDSNYEKNKYLYLQKMLGSGTNSN